jgi:hypothetical protein
MLSTSWNSTAMVKREVATMEESSMERKRPRETLGGSLVGHGPWCEGMRRGDGTYPVDIATRRSVGMGRAASFSSSRSAPLSARTPAAGLVVVVVVVDSGACFSLLRA